MGAAPEIVDDGVTGYLCDDHEHLVAALQGPGRGRPEACRMAVETHFSMQRMVRDHLDLYERLLAG